MLLAVYIHLYRRTTRTTSTTRIARTIYEYNTLAMRDRIFIFIIQSLHHAHRHSSEGGVYQDINTKIKKGKTKKEKVHIQKKMQERNFNLN